MTNNAIASASAEDEDEKNETNSFNSGGTLNLDYAIEEFFVGHSAPISISYLIWYAQAKFCDGNWF